MTNIQGFKISLDFVKTLPSTNHRGDEKLRGVYVSYDCSSKINKKAMRRFEKEFGRNVREVTQDNDQSRSY